MYWFYDVECAQWDQLVVGVAYSEAGEIVRFHTKQGLADWYLSLPGSDIVVAHNGGKYDFILLIDACPNERWTAKMAGSGIVSCRAKGHAECRDSFRLFPLSLAKWTGGKTDVGLDCECGSDCGGYCAIKVGLSGAKLRRLTEYCENDCVVLAQTWASDIQRLQDSELEILGPRGMPRMTLGAVAWATAARMADLDCKEPVPPADYTAGRHGYYGGRCEVLNTRSPVGYRYDVHAMYPWALTMSVPVGSRRAVLQGEARRAFEKRAPGIYHAKVQIDETDIPPLPHRYTDRTRGRLHTDRLLWATGMFDGWYTPIELAAAERHGTRIRDIDCAHLWDSEAPEFEPYVRFIYDLRREAKESGDDRWARVLKWYANSLSGKLAQRPDVATVHVVPDGSQPEEGWDWLGGRVFAERGTRVSPCARSWQAAYLTSRARVALLDRLKRNEANALYCDTDSTYLSQRDDTGVHASRLGSWGYEGEARDWLALAPKLYRYRDERGKEHVRARGVPRPTWGTLDTLAEGREVRREVGVLGIRSSGGDFKRRVVKRTHHDAGNDRCGTRFIRPDGSTRPIHRNRRGEYV